MNTRLEPIPIAFCITELDPGGAERALVRLATGLNPARWRPTVYCLSGYGPLADDLVAAGIPTHCLGAKNWRSARVIGELARRLRSEPPALLQTFLFHANVAGRIAGWRAGIKPIVSGHRVAEKERRWHVWLDRLTGNLADCHVCVSQGVAEFAEREIGLPARRLVVIPNGVELSRFADAPPADLSPWGIAPGTPVFIAIGRLEPQKGMPVLLEAFALLQASHPAARLLIVGEGSQRTQLEQRIQSDPRLAPAVHLLGRRDDIPALLKSATCLVSSSLWEGLPNVILEAFAAARPVVATQIEGSRELVRPGETGWLAAPGSSSELAQAMRQVLEAPEQAREYGQRAQQEVRAHYSWERMVARYEELYERLIADCHGPRFPAACG